MIRRPVRNPWNQISIWYGTTYYLSVLQPKKRTKKRTKILNWESLLQWRYTWSIEDNHICIKLKVNVIDPDQIFTHNWPSFALDWHRWLSGISDKLAKKGQKRMTDTKKDDRLRTRVCYSAYSPFSILAFWRKYGSIRSYSVLAFVKWFLLHTPGLRRKYGVRVPYGIYHSWCTHTQRRIPF